MLQKSYTLCYVLISSVTRDPIERISCQNDVLSNRTVGVLIMSFGFLTFRDSTSALLSVSLPSETIGPYWNRELHLLL